MNFSFRNQKLSFKQNKIIFNSKNTLGPGNTVGGLLGGAENLMRNFAE